MTRSRIATDRVGRTIAVLLALVAVAALTAAWLITRTTDRREAAVRAPVPSALTSSAATATRATRPPATRPPATRPPATRASSPPASRSSAVSSTPSQTSVRASATTARSSARPSAPATTAQLVYPITPGHLFVPRIGVNTTIAPKPTEQQPDPFLHKVVPTFGVPDDMYTTTWWSSGPRPGANGMAVVLGHTQIGGYGVFNKLAQLRRGQTIGIASGDTVLRFSVIAVHTGISKTDPNALTSLLSNHPATARLALLTCSGTFDENVHQSAENTVVFATLAAVTRS